MKREWVRKRARPGLVVELLLIGIALGLLAGPAAAEDPAGAEDTRDTASPTTAATAADLEKRLAALQAAVAELEAESDGTARLAELERQIGVLAEEIEKLQLGEAAAVEQGGGRGFAPAAARVYRSRPSTVSMGGYGEMLYENFDSQRQDGAASGKRDQADLLRAVAYVGYKFDDRFLFNSEIEFEHGSTGKGGEVSVEFAYLEYAWRPALGARAGLLLLPVGFVNELHEPPVFLGARRPAVERAILPSTWRETGFGVFGESGPFVYRATLTNSLDAAGFSASGIRGGRGNGARAKAEDFALTARLDVLSVGGALFGVSCFSGDTAQGARDAAGKAFGARLTLFDLHGEWRWRGLQVRGLYARGRLHEARSVNEANGLTGDKSVGGMQQGYYAEAGFDVLAAAGKRSSLIPFLRYERLATQREVPRGYQSNPANEARQWTAGLAYKPIDAIVLKLDYEDASNDADRGVDQVSFALGYLF